MEKKIIFKKIYTLDNLADLGVHLLLLKTPFSVLAENVKLCWKDKNNGKGTSNSTLKISHCLELLFNSWAQVDFLKYNCSNFEFGFMRQQ